MKQPFSVMKYPQILLASLLAASLLAACTGAGIPQSTPTSPAAPVPTAAPAVIQPAYPAQNGKNKPVAPPATAGSYPAPSDQNLTQQAPGSVQPTQGSYPPPAAATPAATQPASNPASAAKGVVVYDKAAGKFHTFGLDGSNQNQDLPAQGVDYLIPTDVRIAGQSLYYYSANDKVIYKATASGAQALEFTRGTSTPTGFAISADGSQMAWSKDNLQGNPPDSELWIAAIDGSNAKMVAKSQPENGQAMFLMMRPYRWTADGKLLYEEQPTGIGGYILFAGLNSLYVYDPAANTNTAIEAAGPTPNLCLDTLFPGELTRGVFSCGASEKSVITFRSLPDGKVLNTVPAVDDQGVAGAAVFSPDGATLAYSVARHNPDKEHGQVVVVPVNLSSAPKSIASVEPGYCEVEGWASSTQILFQKYEGDQSSVWVVNADGSGAAKIADGQYVGMLK